MDPWYQKWVFIYKNSTNPASKKEDNDKENTTQEDYGENNEDGNSKFNWPKKDPTEQILIEQNFEFNVDIWQRVVIEFKRSKFRVQVAEEF